MSDARLPARTDANRAGESPPANGYASLWRAGRGLRRLAIRALSAPMDFELLIPLWGERHVRRFAALTLRTLLAPRNLPWLAEHHRLQVTILTTRDSLAYFAAEPAFRRLATMAGLAYVEIDDLIAAYGRRSSLVLTRAYNRAMALSPDMLSRNFVYLTGDLVFSDGSLETMARAMAGNDACVMCAPRVAADSVEPLLAALGTSEALALPSREMGRMLLDHPHPTLAASVVEADRVRLSVASRFYWRPTPDAIVARCFLPHLLCIRPTRRPRDIAAPCDFAFAAELAPDGRYHDLTDSDAFLALRVLEAGHEVPFVTARALGPEETAAALAYWSTAQHRRFVAATYVFRAGDSAYSGEEGAALSQPYIDRLLGRLPAPRDHRHHPFWLRSLGADLLSPPREVAALQEASASIPPVLRRLILAHLAADRAGAPGFAISIADRPGPIDTLLAGHAETAARMPPARFYQLLEDVAGPDGPLLIVGGGGLQDYLDLFQDHSRLLRLLRAAGADRTILLSYRVDPDALRQGRPSRAQLRDCLTLTLPLFARYGLSPRLHDLAAGPLDEAHGFVIEIVPEGPAPATALHLPDEAADDPLLGRRGAGPWPELVMRPPAPPRRRRVRALRHRLRALVSGEAGRDEPTA